ncbi:sensor histidine kinase [Thermoflavimicrobium dichotomicum]|uniref:histidine kinase n=1 Tax=Thermoflavimicrobium dichotomicum TaxID=46223 RepID=A0A1I3S0J0_9BACL|nr:ATP-binding protein [Thermoflavimicrobium dichotomicum]SFJ51061.1 His Kinase A (phospho-acceptor) domain-containing protein [Thermoflavimicrobium dichotomicum]
MRGLYARLAFTFIGMVSVVIFIAAIVLMIETHYHFLQYQEQAPILDSQMVALNHHFEMALIQSIIWTTAGSLILAVTVSFYIAKRITAPLIEMRRVAEEIRQGNVKQRVQIQGRDELADLGRALNHLTEQLEQQELLRKNLTADVAHELRTPLTTLKSHMEAFEDGIWEPTPERIHSCYEEIERLIHLVDDLHQLTRLESPEFQLSISKINLLKMVQRSVNQMEAAYLQKGVSLRIDTNQPLWMEADPERMVQIVMNLLSNALKFTPKGGCVTVRIQEKEEHIFLVVEDTGIGIPRTDLSKVFERFYRVDKSRSRRLGGAGIGLTIVKKLVEAHQGTIWIESEENKGTRVTIQFPKSFHDHLH